MTQRQLLAVAVGLGAFLLFARRGQAAPGTSPLVPVPTNGAPFPALAMVAPVNGRYLFPLLPQAAAYTTDPATGQVYVTNISVPRTPGYVSTADVLR